jgi:hypothetical protein
MLTSKKGRSSLLATRSRAALVGMERASPCTHTGTKRRGEEQAAGAEEPTAAGCAGRRRRDTRPRVCHINQMAAPIRVLEHVDMADATRRCDGTPSVCLSLLISWQSRLCTAPHVGRGADLDPVLEVGDGLLSVGRNHGH